jgi:hypothetical protein
MAPQPQSNAETSGAEKWVPAGSDFSASDFSAFGGFAALS